MHSQHPLPLTASAPRPDAPRALRKLPRPLLVALAVTCGLPTVAPSTAAAQQPGKMAITTSSPEAKRLFLDGFALLNRRRFPEAHARCQEAAARDQNLAVAHLCVFVTAGSRTESYNELRKAVSLAGTASEPERLWILSDDAIVRGDVAAEKAALDRLVALLPGDAFPHYLLGSYYYRRRDYANAITAYLDASKLDPAFALACNQLGYSYEFLARYSEAEATFRQCIEQLPGDPNPYDSYGELLMKLGRYAASIQQYEKALAIDHAFATAYIGIGNDQMFLGQLAAARTTFTRYLAAARAAPDQRLAWLWTALSHIHEGHTSAALAAVAKARAIAEAAGDTNNAAADLHLAGDILLDARRPADAAAQFEHQQAAVARGSAPNEVKAASQRDAAYDRGRVALARGDLATAQSERDRLLREATEAGSPPSLFRAHALAGLVALAGKNPAAAVTELERADPQDPRARYLLAIAVEATGDLPRAQTLFGEVAGWNAPHPELAFVRTKAIAAAARLARTGPRP